MGSVISALFGNAMGVAISPLPLIALILILFTAKAGPNSISFIVGWIASIFAIALLVATVGVSASPGEPDATQGWIQVAVGALFLFLAFQQFQRRPKDGEEATVPSWMERIETMGPGAAFVMGLALGFLNPKNMGLVAAAGATVASADLDSGQVWIVVIVYALMGSLTMIIPVFLFFVANDWATPILTRFKDWLIANNATVMMLLFLLLGANALGAGISTVSAADEAEAVLGLGLHGA